MFFGKIKNKEIINFFNKNNMKVEKILRAKKGFLVFCEKNQKNMGDLMVEELMNKFCSFGGYGLSNGNYDFFSCCFLVDDNSCFDNIKNIDFSQQWKNCLFEKFGKPYIEYIDKLETENQKSTISKTTNINDDKEMGE